MRRRSAIGSRAAMLQTVAAPRRSAAAPPRDGAEARECAAMSTTVRAGIAVALLVGFYLVAFGIVGGLAAVALWLWQAHPGTAAAKVSFLVIALAVGIVAALWKVLRAKPAPPAGLLVDERRAPELWATVRGLAAAVQTRPPDEIRLVPEVNAAVSEDATMLGLRPGRRYLYLGVPLLQGFTVSQLCAVLAHELGHYSHSHTRLGALNYRGRMTIVRTIQEIGPSSIAGWILRAYARLYFLVESAVSRRQELEADQAAVRIAGRGTAIGMMRELHVVDQMWHFYLNNYVGWGWEAGYAPQGVFVGFHQLLYARGEAMARLRREPIEEKPSRWDTHPPTSERIAAMAAMPEAPVGVDNRPAIALLPDPGPLLHEVETTMLDLAGRTVLPWEDFTPAAAHALVQRESDVLFRAARQVTRSAGAEGADVLGGLADVKVGKDAYDVLILDRGLVLVPSTGKSDEGRRRLLWLVQSAPVAELARRHWFLPYEEVAAAKIVKQVPVRVELTLHNGQSVSLHETWGGEDLGNDSRKILKAAVAPFVRSGPD